MTPGKGENKRNKAKGNYESIFSEERWGEKKEIFLIKLSRVGQERTIFRKSDFLSSRLSFTQYFYFFSSTSQRIFNPSGSWSWRRSFPVASCVSLGLKCSKMKYLKTGVFLGFAITLVHFLVCIIVLWSKSVSERNTLSDPRNASTSH